MGKKKHKTPPQKNMEFELNTWLLHFCKKQKNKMKGIKHIYGTEYSN